MITLRPDQSDAVRTALENYKSNARRRLMITSPTGTGKSYIALAILDAIPGSIFVAPSQEILEDMADKMIGMMPLKQSGIFLTHKDVTARFWTVKKLHNRLMQGMELPCPAIIFDEAHHAVDDTHQTVIALLPATTFLFGLTATPYRGTPQSSAELQLFWGDPHVSLTYTDAARQNLIRIPACDTVPLVDDDTLTASAGDFNITTTTSAYKTKTDDAADILLRYKWVERRVITAPTIVGVCGKEQAAYMADAIERICGVECRIVSAETTRAHRDEIFKSAIDCNCVLIHINVVSEGVDLPIRNYLDLAPTLSPRLWAQRVGRIMRVPTSGMTGSAAKHPHYVCTNRNLERHAYLLQGCIPESYVAQAQQAFPTPSGRAIRRAVGLDSLGKLRADTVRLTSGLVCSFFNVQGKIGLDRVSYLCVLHPTKSEIVWLTRTDARSAVPNAHGGPSYNYGKWAPGTPPDGFKGYGAAPATPLRPNQKSWWDRDAQRYGLDPTQEVTARRFALLPALNDIGATL